MPRGLDPRTATSVRGLGFSPPPYQPSGTSKIEDRRPFPDGVHPRLWSPRCCRRPAAYRRWPRRARAVRARGAATAALAPAGALVVSSASPAAPPVSPFDPRPPSVAAPPSFRLVPRRRPLGAAAFFPRGLPCHSRPRRPRSSALPRRPAASIQVRKRKRSRCGQSGSGSWSTHLSRLLVRELPDLSHDVWRGAPTPHACPPLEYLYNYDVTSV